MIRTTRITDVLLFVLIWAAACAAGQDAENSVDILPRWRKGDRVRYTMVKTRRQKQGDVVTLEARATTPVSITVLEARDDGYLLKWVFGEAKTEVPGQAENPMLKAMSNLVKGCDILLELDEQATLVGVRNWKELQKTSDNVVDIVAREMKRAGVDEGKVRAVCQQVRSMFATRANVESLCTQTPQLLFLPLGRSYPASGSIDYRDRLANPFGGEPFPTRASLALERLDERNGTARVTWHQEVDPAAGKRIIEETLRTLAARMGKSIPPGNVLDSMRITDRATFTVELPSGWPQEFSHTRLSQIMGTSREDTTTFVRVAK
jgi:hypothetical protein